MTSLIKGEFFERNEKIIIFAAEFPGSCEACPDGVIYQGC